MMLSDPLPYSVMVHGVPNTNSVSETFISSDIEHEAENTMRRIRHADDTDRNIMAETYHTFSRVINEGASSSGLRVCVAFGLGAGCCMIVRQDLQFW